MAWVGPWLNLFLTDHRKMVLVGGTLLCWAIWKSKNFACFDKKMHDDPVAVVFVSAIISLIVQYCRQAKTRKHGWRSHEDQEDDVEDLQQSARMDAYST